MDCVFTYRDRRDVGKLCQQGLEFDLTCDAGKRCALGTVSRRRRREGHMRSSLTCPRDLGCLDRQAMQAFLDEARKRLRGSCFVQSPKSDD